MILTPRGFDAQVIPYIRTVTDTSTGQTESWTAQPWEPMILAEDDDSQSSDPQANDERLKYKLVAQGRRQFSFADVRFFVKFDNIWLRPIKPGFLPGLRNEQYTVMVCEDITGMGDNNPPA